MPTKYIIKIDRDLCIGAASCVALASQTFELDAEGKAVVKNQVTDSDDSILAAAKSCPTSAIILEEMGQRVYPEK